ncbi:reverse transcriptase domain-containing protein [Tanacetum coccineum]
MLSTRFSSTAESSPSDSPATTSHRHSHSPSHSFGPYRKRCRSPATTVPSFIPALGALVHTRADLLPPRKRFKDSYSSHDTVEEDIDADVLADIEADATAVEVAEDMDVEAGVDASIGMEVNVGVDIEDKDEGEAEPSDRGTVEVGVDVVAWIDIPDGMLMLDAEERLDQRELEARSLIPGGERAGLLDRVAALERRNARLRDTLRMESAGVDRFRHHMSYMAGEIRQICRFRHYDRLRFRRLEAFAARCLDHDYHSLCGGNGNGNGRGNGDGNGGGNGNGNRGGNGNGNPNHNDRGAMLVTHECTFHDFVKCQSLNFKGTKGVVGLTRWFEKMETIFHIRNCPERYQVKYATCTLLNSALTWWNAHKRSIGVDVAFAMSWREVMKLMTEFTMFCTKMVHEEEDRLKKFIGSLSDNIQGNVIAVEPMRLQDATRIANNLMDRKLKDYAAKRPCTVKCGTSNKVGHMTRDCMNAVAATATQRAPIVNQRVGTCFECGSQGHFRKDRPTLKNPNRGNKTGNKTNEATEKAYVLGGGEVNPDSNVVTGLLGHPFNIDLMPVELGIFNVIIGMDWLENHHAVIVCDEKIVWIPYGDEVLIVQSDRSGERKKSKLRIISCTKTQKYIKKGCLTFLAQVTKKETEDKSEEKRLVDVPIIQDFLEVFLEDLPGLPPTRQIEF